MAGATTTLASEVTGTLSSDTIANAQTTGNLEGTVSSESRGGSSGSSGSSGGGSSRTDEVSGASTSNTPTGTVFGAATENTQTPGFPNAGVTPEQAPVYLTIWSTMVTFLRNIVSF